MPSHDSHKLRLWAQRVSSGAVTVGWLGGGAGHGGGWAFRFHVRGRWGGAGRTAATAHSSGSGAGRKSAMWAGGVANSWAADGGAVAGGVHSASGGVSSSSRTMAGTVRRLRRQARSCCSSWSRRVQSYLWSSPGAWRGAHAHHTPRRRWSRVTVAAGGMVVGEGGRRTGGGAADATRGGAG